MLPPNDTRTNSCKKRKPDLLEIADKPGSSTVHKSVMTTPMLGTEPENDPEDAAMGSLESLAAGVQGFEELAGHAGMSYFLSPEEVPSSQLNTDGNELLTQSQDTENFSDGVPPPDHLLSQFEAYFKGRLQTELKSFHGSMSQLLGEQLVHVRRILSPGSPESVVQTDTEIDGAAMGEAETLPHSAPDHMASGNPD